MKVNVVNKSNHRLPEYATEKSAGLDLKANISEPVVLKPMERVLIPTELYMAVPDGYTLLICSRSGLAIKSGIQVLNAPGVIDCDYRSSISVILINLSNTPYVINPGDRIAQGILVKFEQIEWNEVKTLDETDRKGGFGSTGK